MLQVLTHSLILGILHKVDFGSLISSIFCSMVVVKFLIFVWLLKLDDLSGMVPDVVGIQ